MTIEFLANRHTTSALILITKEKTFEVASFDENDNNGLSSSCYATLGTSVTVGAWVDVRYIRVQPATCHITGAQWWHDVDMSKEKKRNTVYVT